VALARAAKAEQGERDAIAEKELAEELMMKANKARELAERNLRDSEDAVRKKNKKILALQQKLIELGEESDSDAAPDERPPAFFVNEDGTKVPRPRSRKERMSMAFREAESSRWELRIGMAAMLTKDDERLQEISRLQTSLGNTCREVQEVRAANVSLAKQIEEAAMAIKMKASLASTSFASTASASQLSMLEETLDPADMFSSRMPEFPLAASTAAVPEHDPTRPVFTPATLGASSSPRFLVKTSSQPSFIPPLTLYGSMSSRSLEDLRGSPEKLTLAPLRKVKRPASEWHLSWH